MARLPIPSYYFAVVLAVDPGPPKRYLLVHEKRHDQQWYVPAGRVEVGETFAAAACRETLEETGLAVELTGISRIEHTPLTEAGRLRVIFQARAVDTTPPRATPNEHTLGAAWCTLDEAARLPLRGPDVLFLLSRIEQGAPQYPLDLLGDEATYP